MEKANQAFYKKASELVFVQACGCEPCSQSKNLKLKIVAHRGNFLNPESLAHGGDGLPKQPLYTVEFNQSEVWPKYLGESHDRILVDVYQHWLEAG